MSTLFTTIEQGISLINAVETSLSKRYRSGSGGFDATITTASTLATLGRISLFFLLLTDFITPFSYSTKSPV